MGDFDQRISELEKELSELRRKYNEALVNETKFTNIIKSSPMGVHTYVLDINGRLIFTGGNPAADRLLNFDHSQIIGKTIEEAFPPLVQTEVPNTYKSIALGGKPWITESIQYDDGKIAGAFEVHAFQTSPRCVAVYFLEISERKQAEQLLIEQERMLRNQNDEYFSLNEEYLAQNEELTESLERINIMNTELIAASNKAQESDRLKSAFLANMSHEIRTPMNAIVGFAELLVDKGLPSDKIEKYVQIINSNSHQLLNIINDIIDISKIEADQVSLNIEEVNINSVMHEMQSIFKTLASRKNIDILLVCPLDDDMVYLKTDETRFKQVLTNLLGNAIKFTQQGIIEFGYFTNDGSISFYVKDSGIGIAEEHQKLVFERFRQVESATTRKFGGTGLGLSITKALVNKMGGDIWVESELGKGCKFIFKFPNITLIKKPQRQQISHTSDCDDFTWPNKKILIAEDEEANFFLLEEILLSTSVDLLYAADGVEAIDLFNKNEDIDLVILDIKMPNMNGYEALSKIKAIKPEMYVIAQTAYAMADDRKKALASGFDAYLSKPIDKTVLLEIINGVFCKA